MYATGDDLVLRYDADLVGDLATDDRTTLARSEVPQHAAVVAALSGASGQVQSALIRSGRYDPEALTALVGIDREYLADLVCGLAMTRLYQRRPESTPEGWQDQQKQWLDLLERLRNGENIFNLEDTVAATVVDTGGPTVADIRDRNDIAERMSPRYFNISKARLPRGR